MFLKSCQPFLKLTETLIQPCLLGKLILKIPWKNLYSLPVEADVEDLYLLVQPNAAVSYSAEKQYKSDLDTKKSELAKVEEAKKREQERENEKDPKANKSFTEKLVAQIINNVQIRIRNVHIRYEDRSTSTIPFAFGITLSGLEVHTTDENWQRAFVSEALAEVYKLASLDSLAVYMNCNTSLFQSRASEDYSLLFSDSIATSEAKPENYNYGNLKHFLVRSLVLILTRKINFLLQFLDQSVQRLN